MMQDYTRTACYQRAIHTNYIDFMGKTVMDIGAGSGILSYFALQSGASKVYAIEASNMSLHCEKLARQNGFSQDRFKVVAKKLEDVAIGKDVELVDVLISEPLGYMLLNERMLETYIHGRRFLKPGGKMFPSRSILYTAPFYDEQIYTEQLQKAGFWQQPSFHDVDISPLRNVAFQEVFRQPVVDSFDSAAAMTGMPSTFGGVITKGASILSPPTSYEFDFRTCEEEDLHEIKIPFNFKISQHGTCHGLLFWFDTAFDGSEATV